MGTTVLEHVFDWRSWKVAKSFKDSIGFGMVPMETVLKNTSLGSGRPVISYVKQIASPGSMHDTGWSGLVHWDDPERWYGEGGRWEEVSGWGTCIHPWRIHIDVWQYQYIIVNN